MEFIKNYLRSGNATESVRLIPEYSNKPYSTCAGFGNSLLKRPRVQAEIKRIMEEARKEAVATAEEVMSYFTAVMRGEVKDQFGLDAPLAERTRAAQEIARRTVDIENRQKGLADQTVEITLDWSRK